MTAFPTAAGKRLNGLKGFTLIELIVVLAIIALLASIAAPRYTRSVEAAREASLRTSLNVMRDAIDKYAADKGRYPDSLSKLVELGYLRKVPEDPMTGQSDSWQMLPARPGAVMEGNVGDVKSGASGKGLDGSAYSSW